MSCTQGFHNTNDTLGGGTPSDMATDQAVQTKEGDFDSTTSVMSGAYNPRCLDSAMEAARRQSTRNGSIYVHPTESPPFRLYQQPPADHPYIEAVGGRLVIFKEGPSGPVGTPLESTEQRRQTAVESSDPDRLMGLTTDPADGVSLAALANPANPAAKLTAAQNEGLTVGPATSAVTIARVLKKPKNETWKSYPRCSICGAWTKSDGICNNRRCGHKGQQTAIIGASRATSGSLTPDDAAQRLGGVSMEILKDTRSRWANGRKNRKNIPDAWRPAVRNDAAALVKNNRLELPNGSVLAWQARTKTFTLDGIAVEASSGGEAVRAAYALLGSSRYNYDQQTGRVIRTDGAERCPQCGQYKDEGHLCPIRTRKEETDVRGSAPEFRGDDTGSLGEIFTPDDAGVGRNGRAGTAGSDGRQIHPGSNGPTGSAGDEPAERLGSRETGVGDSAGGSGESAGIVAGEATAEEVPPVLADLDFEFTPERERRGVDFQITDSALGNGTEKEKYERNIAAIKLLKQLEAEDRLATPDEQAVLAQYVGWGGLSKAFDRSVTYSWGIRPGNSNPWKERFEELKELLTEEEWEQARETTPNAHYTSPVVAGAMWQALQRMGLGENARILEPSCGVGNFLGMAPAEIADGSTRVGVELDSLTARIARQLYQNADIHNTGFEQANLADNFFDVAISNVPFGNYGVHDPEFEQSGRKHLTRSIHNYFFAKGLDKVAPGGVVAFITSHHTLDAKSKDVRDYLASKADLVGAIRLPNTAFKANAGTEVTTDVIFLRKRAEGDPPGDSSWTETVEMDLIDNRGEARSLPVSRYFVDHPEMVMGQAAATGSMYGAAEYTVESDGRDLGQALNEAVGRLPQGVMTRSETQRCPRCMAFIGPSGACGNPRCPSNTGKLGIREMSDAGQVRDGSFFVKGGKVYRKAGDTADEQKGKDAKRMAGLCAVRDAARQALALNVEQADDEALSNAQTELNQAYDDFVSEFGPLNDKQNVTMFKDDPDAPFIRALERWDGQQAEKAGIFSQRTIGRTEQVETADSAQSSLFVALNESGRINWERMAELTGRDIDSLQTELWSHGQVFMTPDGDWATSDEYLSGNVRKKLREAEAAMAADPRFQLNVDKLQAVQPRDVLPEEIGVRLGQGWIPAEDVSNFARDLLDLYGYRRESITVDYIPELAQWTVTTNNDFKRWAKDGHKNRREWGTGEMGAHELIDLALNGKVPTVYSKDPDGNRYVDQAETLAAREMQGKIQDKFREWLWSDPARTGRLAATYNETFNAIVPRRYDGSHLSLPGLGTDMPELSPHQKDAIWRVIQSSAQGRNTLLGHIVGAGKTYSMVGAGMELRRLGLRNKVMYTIPNHMLEQFSGDIQRMYPGSKILMVAGKNVGTPEARKETMSRIATEDWDAVVVTHSAYGKIPVADETFESFVRQEMDLVEQALRAEMEENPGQAKAIAEAMASGKVGKVKKKTVKQLVKKLKRLKTKLEKRAAKSNKDDALTFEELGIDQLFVDEAHEFKNLGVTTQRGDVAGIGTSESDMALDMFIKTQYLQRRCKCGRFIGADGVCRRCGGQTQVESGGGVVFATGTPIANSVSEMYIMQRFLQSDTLREQGLEAFDAWASQYGETVTSMEMKPSGKGYQEKTRFARFNNVPELMSTFREVADIQMDPVALGLSRPDLEGGKPEGVSVPLSDWQRAYIDELDKRAENLGQVDPKDDNMLKIVSEGVKAALDRRLLDPSLPDDPNSKVNAAVESVWQTYQNTTGVTVPGLEGLHNLTQMIFLDQGTPGGSSGINLYEDIKNKLVARGAKPEEIAFIHDAKSDAQKITLFNKVNSGDVRVIIGSTGKMGTGTNAQRLLAEMHHLDAPWRPADVEQREGRILRRGNMNERVGIRRYITEESFDVYRWQTLERKANFIGQVMSGQVDDRSIEDIDPAVMSYAEMKAIATGNPIIIERIEKENEVKKLRGLQRAWRYKQSDLNWQLKRIPKMVEHHRREIARYEKAGAAMTGRDEKFMMKVGGQVFDKSTDAGQAIITAVEQFRNETGGKGGGTKPIGEIYGCPVSLDWNKMNPMVVVQAGGVDLAAEINMESPAGTIQRLRNAVSEAERIPDHSRQRLAELEQDEADIRAEMARPFEHESRLMELESRIEEISKELAAQDAKTNQAVAASESKE